MKKGIINITEATEIDFLCNQVYVCERIYKGSKCRVYDLMTDCKRECTAIKRLVSVVPELQPAFEGYLEGGCASQLSMACDEIAVEATEFGYYVMAVIFEDVVEETINETEVATCVSYKTFFPEFGWMDYRTENFKSLTDGRNFYNSIKNNYEDVQLWVMDGDRLDFMLEQTRNEIETECSIETDDTNINKDKENENMEENANVVEMVITAEQIMQGVEEEKLLPIEPEYITRLINQANLVNVELAERTRDILYLEDDNRRNLFKIASQLGKIHKGKLFEDDGFKNVSEYAEKVLGYKGSTTRALCRIADRFLDELGEIKNPELADFSLYQLMELLKLNDSELQLALTDGTVSSELSTKKLRDNIKKSKSSETEKTEDESETEKTEDESETEKQEEISIINKEEGKKENKESKITNKQGQAITILTSLIRQISQNESLESDITELYIKQIKHAIECIK